MRRLDTALHLLRGGGGFGGGFGLLGEDFLSRFNLFIDRAHGVLCIYDTGTMEASSIGWLQPEGK